MIPYAWNDSAMFAQRSVGWRAGAPIDHELFDQYFLINLNFGAQTLTDEVANVGVAIPHSVPYIPVNIHGTKS